jgi:endothelin-converting enzyme
MFTGTTMFENSQTLLRHVLEAPYPSSPKSLDFSSTASIKKTKSIDQENFKKMKNVYHACMDENTIEKAGLAPLNKVLRSIQELFHDKEYRQSESIRNAQIISSLSRLGVEALVSLDVGVSSQLPFRD